jgi:PhzF family phenazine biosynthesis protein
MKQAPMRLSPPVTEPDALMEALALTADDLLSTPLPRTVDTGAAHLMVRLRDAAAVDRAAPAAEKLLKVLKYAAAEGCYIYAFDPPSATAYARFFNPTMGLWEDAATGTAAGPLCAYLGNEGLLPGNRLAIEQGTRMGRASILRVALTPEPELTGTGVVVLRGMLQV